MLASDSGIYIFGMDAEAAQKVDFDADPAIFWESILQLAINSNHLESLLGTAIAEYHRDPYYAALAQNTIAEGLL